MLKYSHVKCLMWDVQFGIPTFDFYFKLNISKPQRERVITGRDELGRIVKTCVLNN